MSAASATLAGRTAAQALMVDACTLGRPTGTGRGAYDADTLTYADADVTALYDGKCRVRRIDAEDSHDDSGVKPVGVGAYLVSLPITVTDVKLDDLVTITASALDPSLVGLVLFVRSVAKGSHITARRLVCDEVTV